MGIPAYMSYIMKNYGNMIHSIEYHKKGNIPFDSLYMDCNSIIYDVYNTMVNNNEVVVEEKIILYVIQKIENYIMTIRPTSILFIAFDGVAPFSKMEQQRLRRYKTWHMSTFNMNGEPPKNGGWSTSSITPGTLFMNQLSKQVKYYFEGEMNEKKYGICKIIVTGSDEVGEGEQKIFKYIRNHSHLDKNVFVYGLDSDLIMLSIFHSDRCKNIFVFREEIEYRKSKIEIETKKNSKETFSTHSSSPEFIRTTTPIRDSIVLQNPNPRELLFLDIRRLSDSISIEMNGKEMAYDRSCIYDYLILCFFLGNDFLPHFPSLNIRTNGIHWLIDTYKEVIGKHRERSFVSNEKTNKGKIQWKWLKKFIERITKKEKQMLLNEYEARDKMDYYKWPQTTKEEKENVLNNTPVIYRAEEKYICPTENMWEERYYKILFDMERTHENLEKITTHYLEGLEWVYKYYTDDCPDWKWKYHYNYPPLFIDMVKYIPEKETDFIHSSNKKYASKTPFAPYLQLSYVLPEVNHFLIDEKKRDYLKENYHCLFPEEIIYKWAFCRYFFESHMLLPDIDVCVLEKLEKELAILS